MRPDEREKTLSSAIDVFWRHGYEDTKMEDVVLATGLNRYTLYSNFGGKRDLFLEALRHYKCQSGDILWDGLDDDALPPLSALRRVAAYIIHQMQSYQAGCLLCNVAAQEARKDPIIAERVQEFIAVIENSMVIAMERAAQRGELAPWLTPNRAASLFMTMKLGCGAKAAAGASLTEMLNDLEACLSLLANGNEKAYASIDGLYSDSGGTKKCDQPELLTSF